MLLIFSIYGLGSNFAQWICTKQLIIKYCYKFQLFNYYYLIFCCFLIVNYLYGLGG